jgi:hypothetical protein
LFHRNNENANWNKYLGGRNLQEQVRKDIFQIQLTAVFWNTRYSDTEIPNWGQVLIYVNMYLGFHK